MATLTSDYKGATIVIGPLSPTPEPGAMDLCEEHALSHTAPVGWTLVRLVTEFEPAPPSDDDLMALADAIRAASKKDVPAPEPAQREVRRPVPDYSPPRRPNLSVIDGGNETAETPRRPE